MKAAYLVSPAPSFEDDVWRAAATLGADVHGPYARYRDTEDRFITVFGALDPKNAADWRDDLRSAPGMDAVPDLEDTFAVSVECRREDLFASWVGKLATLLPEPAWVVDGDGVVWPATQVDPNAVRL